MPRCIFWLPVRRVLHKLQTKMAWKIGLIFHHFMLYFRSSCLAWEVAIQFYYMKKTSFEFLFVFDRRKKFQRFANDMKLNNDGIFSFLKMFFLTSAWFKYLLETLKFICLRFCLFGLFISSVLFISNDNEHLICTRSESLWAVMKACRSDLSLWYEN